MLSTEHEELLGPPEAVAAVLDRPRDAVEEGSTSGVSTINSTKSAKLLHDLHHSKHCHHLQDNLQASRVENLRSAPSLLFTFYIQVALSVDHTGHTSSQDYKWVLSSPGDVNL